MKLTSYGAALEVTGSQHLLEVNGKKILLDCGLFQGHRKEAFEKNAAFGFDPVAIDAMVLSHAHIDHSGNIPTLVKRGYRGLVYCTEATRDLCDLMLLDSAFIQESDADFFARHLSETALKPIEPLYTQEDAHQALLSFKGMSMDKPFTVAPGVTVTFREAGHVLGSALVVLDIEDHEDGKKKRLLFTGDLGRCRLPILKDPYQVTEADYLLTESTYGNRSHAPMEEGLPELARVVNRTARRGGKILIPAFALERTQELLYSLNQLIQQKEIPSNIPIFLDSPLATGITDIFRRHVDLYDDDFKKLFKKGNPFEMRQLKFMTTVEDSKKLNFFIGPCIIISASGMCEAGRIRHHLRNHIENPNNTVAVVGYMAEGTLGRKLVEGAPMVKIFDEMLRVRAEIVVLESFSAHADQADLNAYVQQIRGLKKIMLVHGEPDQSGPMAERLHGLTGAETVVNRPREPISL